MKGLRLLVGLLLVGFFMPVLGQNGSSVDKYWVYLTDKGDLSVYTPGDLLSQKALDRRARHGIMIQDNDYPVASTYIQGVAQAGAVILQPSKWFNAVSVEMDAATAVDVAALPFVREVASIRKYKRDMEPVEQYKTGYATGSTESQLEMIGLDQMHQNGFNGTGVTIALMDNGFQNVDNNLYLSHLFTDNRIQATWDFVNNDENVYDEGWHGSAVLSILAGWKEEVQDSFNFYGSAHGATYILCHTENDASETTQEEDNWVAAMEFADSAGADIFSTSLGYSGMDDPNTSYDYSDFDGNTTIITIAADLAASKGIIVVNSAGNSGQNKITAPADGDSVIAVGAVDAERILAGFSSRGPSFDGRVKPDVCAMGFQATYVTSGGELSRGNGTSFSCPVMSGFIACILQAKPGTQNMELYDALIKGSHLYDNPDDDFGYGIPTAAAVLANLGADPLEAIVSTADLLETGSAVFPNPATDVLNIVIDNDATGYAGSMEIYDMVGKRIMQKDVRVDPFYNVFHLREEIQNLQPGKYVLRLTRENFEEPIMNQVFILVR